MAQQSPSPNGKPRHVITKGYLMKQGTLLNKSFKKKYFILYQGRTLSHFETHGCAKQIGEIDLSHVSQITYRTNIKATSKCKYAFDVITPSKTWTLGCADQHECDEWVGHLRTSAFGNTLFTGWLHKRGGKVQTWKHRFFVLSDTKILRYYEDEDCTKYKGCIFLNDVIKIQTGDPQQEHDNIIYLTTPSRIWCISAESKESQHEWIEKLNDGQNQINYDDKASIFVNINKQSTKCRGNVENATCLSVERIKFVCCIYAKWIKSHRKQQVKDRQLRASLEERHSAVQTRQFRRANTTKIQSFSNESTSSDEMIATQRSLPVLRARTTDLYAMKIKYKLRRGMYGIINNDLKEYSNKELLNDFNHILEQHHTTKKFELLCQYLNKTSDAKDDELPLSLLRIYRSRCNYSDEANHMDREELYFNYKDVSEIAMQQVLDKIYCHLFHSSLVQVHELDKHKQSDKKVNDDDEDMYIDCQEQVLLNTKRLLNHKREALRKAEGKLKLQLRNNKFIAVTETVPVKEDHHVFGNKRFYYWKSCTNEALYVAAKYNSLKDELLNNSLCNLSLPQFETIYHKSNDLHDTDRALIIGAFSGWKIGSGIQGFVQRYGIEEGTPIKIHHMIASVVYCNYYAFAESYRSTYCATHEAQHNEFAHFSRYLVECVLVFGASITNKMSLYHGVDGEDVILYDLSAKYIAPVSMTEHVEVAWCGDNDGLIVCLTQQDNLSAFNMDCSWLSDFVFESERIVVANTEPMRVDTIIHRQEYANYSVYIHAIDSLSHLISSTKPIYLTNEVTKKALNKMITRKTYKYIDRLFANKCLMVTNIECDCRQICEVMNKDGDDNNGCYSIFRSLLIDPSHDWIKIDLFVMLFPNLNAVTIRCFNHLTFNQNTASKLFNVLQSKIVRKKPSFRVEWIEANESDMSYLDIVHKYDKVFEKLNYQMVGVNDSIIIRKDHNKKRKSKKQVVNDTVNMKGNDANNPDGEEVIDDADCLIM
eukprot:29129_1